MMKRIWFLLFSGLLVSCQTGGLKISRHGETGELVDMNQVDINLRFLASDALEGREAASNAEKVASLYLAAELEKYGVQPYDTTNDSYFQNIDLRVISYREDPQFEIVDATGQTLHRFQAGTDFVGYPRYYQTVDTIAPLVFAGYGITAEEYDYDDYKNIDVSGKIVLLFPGEPFSEDTSYFAGEERTKYSDLRSKVKTAKNNGAIGVVGVSDRLAEYGWDSFKQFASNKRYQLKDEPVHGKSDQLPVTFSNAGTLKRLFGLAGYTTEESDRFIDENIAPPAFELPQKAKILWGFDTTGTAVARNVVGVVEGTDPQMKHEYVTLGAHYDHVGMGQDGVHNGADDNASGTVAILEVARLFAKYGQNQRSILLTFHTAEEKGLIGSRYFTDHVDNIDDFVAHINLDMVGRGNKDSIFCIGSDKISMEYHELVKEVNYSGSAMYLDYSLNNPADPMRLYYRSDHYSFARKGVPSVFFFDFDMTDYHQPSDDYEKINLEKIGRVTRLAYEIALAAANKRGRFKKIEALAD